MHPEFFFKEMLSPYAIISLLALVVFSSISATRVVPRRFVRIGIAKTFCGYGVIVAVMSVVGWSIEHFSFASGHGLASLFLIYLAILIMSTIGLPTVAALVATNHGSIAWCLLAGSIIGIFLVFGYYLASNNLWVLDFVDSVISGILLSLFPILVMASFCVGARIPWRAKTTKD